MPVQNKTNPDAPSQDDEPTPIADKAKSVSTGRGSAPTETSKSQVKVVEPDEDAIPQSYVWLANGEVLLCNDEDLAEGHVTSAAPHGHWIKDGKVFQVVAVYAKEEKAEE